MNAPRLSVTEIALFERPVRLRLPFRFGIVTLTETPQAFVRLRLRLADGREAWGQAAELLVPKWFDKDPSLTNDDNLAQLRQALCLARDLYLAAEADSAFGLHARIEPELHARCLERGLGGLIASFGGAMIDRAILDALGKAEGLSIFRLVAANRPGIDARTARDLEGFALDDLLAGLQPRPTIAYRHTVGLIDALTEAEIAPDARLDDGLPESLEAVIRTYRPRWFKLKVGGDRAADLDRLERIAAVLEAEAPGFRATIDGNEQYGSAGEVVALLRAMADRPRLRRLLDATVYVEQPIARARALEATVHDLAALKPVALDESDADMGTFVVGRRLGYAGMSSKSCKGFYRSVLNRARVAMWNEVEDRYFLTAEDLTTQAGLAVQEDLALATLVGCTHVERNGHHYVDGFGDAPEAEALAFLGAHPDLYHRSGGRVRLRIAGGDIALGSLACPGLGAAAEPHWPSLRPFADG